MERSDCHIVNLAYCLGNEIVKTEASGFIGFLIKEVTVERLLIILYRIKKKQGCKDRSSVVNNKENIFKK